MWGCYVISYLTEHCDAKDGCIDWQESLFLIINLMDIGLTDWIKLDM